MTMNIIKQLIKIFKSLTTINILSAFQFITFSTYQLSFFIIALKIIVSLINNFLLNISSIFNLSLILMILQKKKLLINFHSSSIFNTETDEIELIKHY